MGSCSWTVKDVYLEQRGKKVCHEESLCAVLCLYQKGAVKLLGLFLANRNIGTLVSLIYISLSFDLFFPL